jgi:hypothetical protein
VIEAISAILMPKAKNMVDSILVMFVTEQKINKKSSFHLFLLALCLENTAAKINLLQKKKKKFE